MYYGPVLEYFFLLRFFMPVTNTIVMLYYYQPGYHCTIYATMSLCMCYFLALAGALILSAVFSMASIQYSLLYNNGKKLYIMGLMDCITYS